MKNTRTHKSGFTLIELLISITIIGILSAIAIPRLVNVVPQARDSARLASVNEFVAAIESYNLENGNYPNSDFCFSTSTGAETVYTAPAYTVAEFVTDYYKGQPPALKTVEKDPAIPLCADGIAYYKATDGYVVSIPLERDQQANSTSPKLITGTENLIYKVIVR